MHENYSMPGWNIWKELNLVIQVQKHFTLIHWGHVARM